MTVKKRSTQPDWTSLRYFVELSRHGSLSATARALGVTHATVSRRIASLEEALDSPLFERKAGRYMLTSHGARIFEIAEAMEEGALSIERVVAGTTPELVGKVRITTIEFVAASLLCDPMTELAERYPGLELELITDSRNLSLARHEADIALRLARPDQGNLVTRKVLDIAYYVYVSDAAADPSRGRSVGLIGYDEANLGTHEAQYLLDNFPENPCALATNNQQVRRIAAESGAGAALLPRFIAERSAGLRLLDPAAPPLVRELWLLLHPDLKDAPRIRETSNHIVASLTARRSEIGPLA